MKQHYVILAKVLNWAADNEIEVKLGMAKFPGLKDQVEITLGKNGRQKLIRFMDFGELEKHNIQTILMNQAFELCLTRLEL